MRAYFLAGLLLAGAAACAPEAMALQAKAARQDSQAAAGARENSALVRATAPTQEPRTYEGPAAALLEADLDYIVSEARRNEAQGDAAAWGAIIFIDDFASGDYAAARAALARLPDGVLGAGGDMFEPFLLAAEGQGNFALERLDHGAGGVPDPLPNIARALVLEALGRLEEAGAVYGQIEADIDTAAPRRGEPRNEAELMRALNATRTSQTLYRAALVQHRLGRRAEAERLYGLVEGFAPNSADLRANLVRLARGEAPIEPALDARSALGRWLLFVSDHMQMTEGVTALIASGGNIEGLSSPAGTMFLQFGILLDPSAEDWTLGAASQLVEADGYDGASRILARISDTSVFAADAQLARAGVLVRQREDAQAATAAQRAMELAADRWGVLTGAGDILRLTGQDAQSIAAHDRALALTQDAADRADVLTYRAFAHRFAGRVEDAARDANAALALDQKDNTRYMAVSILMDSPANWPEAIRIARELFAEQPDNYTRLNALGYALIQRPEGLEEGYRLLWRGFSYRDTDYAIVDSLGWAYYLHGAFTEARALIERSNELSRGNPDPEVLDHLGDVYWRLNDREEAREAWRQALQARPDALRRRSLEQKVSRGLTTPPPERRALPQVTLPTGPAERGDT
ncbi:MAG: tetratricopeptide repeat protein [Hyphomonadaceae bacterium]